MIETQQPTTQNNRMKLIVISLLLVLAAGLTVLTVVLQKEDSTKTNPSTYAECLTAGGVVMESYPEQCSFEGQTFVNEDQASDPNLVPGEDSFEDDLCSEGLCDEEIEESETAN